MGSFSTANLKFLWRGDNLLRAENPCRSPLQAFGSVTVNSGDARALDGQSVALGGTKNDYLQLLDPTGDLPNQDFYLYVRAGFWGNSSGSPMVMFGRAPGSGQQSYYLYANGNRSGVWFWTSTDGSASSSTAIGGAVDLTDGAPHTFEVSRQAGTLRLFVDGVLAASQSRPTFYSLPNTQCFIGRIGVSSYEYPAKMTVDEIALVIGEPVETADHAVRTTPFPTPDAAQGYQMPQGALIRGAERPPVASRFDPSPYLLDLEDGGRHRIVGTVKVKGSPNVPVHRRVVLINERSRRIVRETWSDPVTGAYAFESIRGDVAYTTLAYDYTGNYRGVLADNLTAERMP